MPCPSSLVRLPNPHRWDKATTPPYTVSWWPMAALVALIVTGAALAAGNTHLSLAARTDFVVSAAAMLWAFRVARSCERAAVLALVRWVLQASLLQGSFAPGPSLVDATPVILVLFFEPLLTAATLFFSTSIRWQIERTVHSDRLRWTPGQPEKTTSAFAIFVAIIYILFLFISCAIFYAYNNINDDIAASILLSIFRSVFVIAALSIDRQILSKFLFFLLLFMTIALYPLSAPDLLAPFTSTSINIITIIYFIFSDHQRARIWREVRT